MSAETTGRADDQVTGQPDQGGAPVTPGFGATGAPPEVPGVPGTPRGFSDGLAFSDGLWVDRIGTRRYVGHNTRGAQVHVGPVTAGAVFTPGELMKIALAGCSGMSADASLARRLGDDVAVSVYVSGPSDPAEVRYPALHEELVVDLSGLSRQERDRVVTIIRRAIDRSCTVGRTLQQSASVELTINTHPDAEQPDAEQPDALGSAGAGPLSVSDAVVGA